MPLPERAPLSGPVSMSIFARFLMSLVLLSPTVPVSAADVSVADYQSIQAAIDENPGREIHVPAGDYVIDQTLRITGSGTALVGAGRILMTDPGRHIFEIEHAQNIRLAGLTFTRPEGKMDTTREGILVSDATEVTLERIRVIDNRSTAGSIRFSEVRDGKIIDCEVRNYMTISVDDRTANRALLGYAFRCIDGTGIVCDRCRGTLIRGNRIVETHLRPTPDIQKQHQLGKFTKKNETKGTLISQEVWDQEYTGNWHQGSGVIVTGPTQSELTRIVENQIENAAQGIDIHADYVIIANNFVVNAFIGMKAMHGSRHIVVTGNQFSRCVLWAIGFMPGAASEPAVLPEGDRPFTPANIDGGSLIANNVISKFGYGDSYWMWKDASRAVFRFDKGQEPTDPPLRDVLITGNLIANPDRGELSEEERAVPEFPRYHYAVRIESGAENSPQTLHLQSNVFPSGVLGVMNVELKKD